MVVPTGLALIQSEVCPSMRRIRPRNQLCDRRHDPNDQDGIEIHLHLTWGGRRLVPGDRAVPDKSWVPGAPELFPGLLLPCRSARAPDELSAEDGDDIDDDLCPWAVNDRVPIDVATTVATRQRYQLPFHRHRDRLHPSLPPGR